MKTEPTQSPETIAVLENQLATAATSATIKKLEKAIGECEARIAEQQAALPDLAPLENQREDLLAAIAIGEKKSAEVDKLDAEIARLSKQQQAATPALVALKQTVGGLQRRLQDSQAELQQLQNEKSILMRRFLNSRAEALGAEYVAAAAKTAEQYKRLMALNSLLYEHGQTTQINTSREGLYVPRFMLDSMVGHADPVRPHALFTCELHTGAQSQAWVRQEKESLLEIGIELA